MDCELGRAGSDMAPAASNQAVDAMTNISSFHASVRFQNTFLCVVFGTRLQGVRTEMRCEVLVARACVRVLQERTAVVNLTDAYAGSVVAATRQFSLAADYTQLVITDNIIPRSAVDAAATTLTWTMHTCLPL